MIQAKQHPFIVAFFRYYAKLNIKRHFNSVKIIGETALKNNSVLLISNHISWWDGFWALYLSNRFFQKRFYFMMLEKELRKRWLFSYAGGFSVSKNSKSMIDSLNYASRLLNDSGNLVLIFPQGKMHSQHNEKPVFEKGLEYILKKTVIKPQIILSVTMLEYFDKKKPDLFFYIKKYDSGIFTKQAIQNAYHQFLEETYLQHKNMYL